MSTRWAEMRNEIHFGNQSSAFPSICLYLLSQFASLSLPLLASCFVSRSSGGRRAKKRNRQFGPRLFSLLIGLVFLVEQAGVHLDVTYQRQAQGSGPAFPYWLTVKRAEERGRRKSTNSSFICQVYCEEVCDFI